MIVYVLFVHKKSVSKIKNLKKPKNHFYWVFLGGFFWVGFYCQPCGQVAVTAVLRGVTVDGVLRPLAGPPVTATGTLDIYAAMAVQPALTALPWDPVAGTAYPQQFQVVQIFQFYFSNFNLPCLGCVFGVYVCVGGGGGIFGFRFKKSGLVTWNLNAPSERTDRIWIQHFILTWIRI
jgi:hypothetical protein